MPLAAGRPYVAIPGPSVVPDRVLAAMHRASPDIYSGTLHDTTASLFPDLRRVAMTTGHVAMYIGNGHAAWEAAATNMLSQDDRVLVPATGQFGLSWAAAVRRLGVGVDLIDFGRRMPADPERIAAALRADRDGRIRAVLVTHVDTATSIRNDIPAIRAAIDAAGHPALLAVDAIASLGCDELRMDDWGIDVLIAASQKGLMTPPGLCFVWFGDKASRVARGAGLRTPYWDWGPRADPAEYWQTFCGTAPAQLVWGLREALTMLLDEEGLAAAWARHDVLARTVWAAFDAWAAAGDIAMNAARPEWRSRAVTSARIGGGGAGRLRAWTVAEAGLTLGIGLGMAEAGDPAQGDFLRVAHMGHVSGHMTLGLLAVMEAGMRALGIDHGAGALDAAAAVAASASAVAAAALAAV
ncbi:MAG: pyridoxal-phosphate-dependent aminotransferase family protein [Pseudomonadota bacterium]